jgi:hypothetical protein
VSSVQFFGGGLSIENCGCLVRVGDSAVEKFRRKDKLVQIVLFQQLIHYIHSGNTPNFKSSVDGTVQGNLIVPARQVVFSQVAELITSVVYIIGVRQSKSD